VPNIVKVFSIRPDGLRAFMGMENAVMHSQAPGLTRVQREMIALVVSVVNSCHF
jgi:alkylhydroperoxidase family enzyme